MSVDDQTPDVSGDVEGAEEEGPPTEGVEGPTVTEEAAPSVEAEGLATEEGEEEGVATEEASNAERAELAAAHAEIASEEEDASNEADGPAEPAASRATKTCVACSVDTTLLDAPQCPSCGNPFS